MSVAYSINEAGYLVSTVSLDYAMPGRTDLITVEPPPFVFGYARRFVDGAWVQVPDDRWRVYTLPSGQKWSAKTIGETPPAGAVEDQLTHTNI